MTECLICKDPIEGLTWYRLCNCKKEMSKMHRECAKQYWQTTEDCTICETKIELQPNIIIQLYYNTSCFFLNILRNNVINKILQLDSHIFAALLDDIFMTSLIFATVLIKIRVLKHSKSDVIKYAKDLKLSWMLACNFVDLIAAILEENFVIIGLYVVILPFLLKSLIEQERDRIYFSTV